MSGRRPFGPKVWATVRLDWGSALTMVMLVIAILSEGCGGDSARERLVAAWLEVGRTDGIGGSFPRGRHRAGSFPPRDSDSALRLDAASCLALENG